MSASVFVQVVAAVDFFVVDPVVPCLFVVLIVAVRVKMIGAGEPCLNLK
jgi:hypothetical protein